MKKLTAMVAAVTMVVAMAPVNLGAASPALTGGVRGAVTDNTGQSLPSGLRTQLVNSQGNAVPGMTTAVVNGQYAFTNVAPGMYTVQVIGAKGMSAVNVTAGKFSVANVSVMAAPRQGGGGLSTTAKLLIVAAVAGGGVVAYVLLKNDASGSK